VLGWVVGVTGTLLLLLPATIAAGLAEDYKTGRCYGDDLFGDLCHITAAEAYATMLAMLVGPSVLGLLIAAPRRVLWWIGGLLVLGVATYLLLLSGEYPGPPPEHYHGDPATFGA
jgi:hypothetical protein